MSLRMTHACFETLTHPTIESTRLFPVCGRANTREEDWPCSHLVLGRHGSLQPTHQYHGQLVIPAMIIFQGYAHLHKSLWIASLEGVLGPRP
jgi:hypothetical protein